MTKKTKNKLETMGAIALALLVGAICIIVGAIIAPEKIVLSTIAIMTGTVWCLAALQYAERKFSRRRGH